MELPIDIWRFICSYLSIMEIFNLLRLNKYFYNILSKKLFWIMLFRERVQENINIPDDVDIKWLQEKLRYLNEVKKLVHLIIEDKVEYFFIKDFNENWNSFELVENLKELYFDSGEMDSLPPMKNLEELRCTHSNLKYLPPLPKLIKLDCWYNKLLSLPSSPNLICLWCHGNQLTSLPDYPKLMELVCEDNPLSNEILEKYKSVIIPAPKYNY